MNIRQNKAVAIGVVLIVYAFALASATATIALLGNMQSIVLKTFLADLVATGVVFICSVIVNNSSMYDPYWSVAVPVMLYYWIAEAKTGWSLPIVLLFAVILLWSIRLTANCLVNWEHLGDEDWRYVSFRKKFGNFYWPVSLVAVHLFPTLIVFACCIPAFTFIQAFGNSSSTTVRLLWYVPGIILIFGGFLLQLVSDYQMLRFKQNNPGGKAVCAVGLWRYSRHPNYLGELSVWFGVMLCSLSIGEQHIVQGVFPLAMLALFLGYSIPVMEKRMVSKRPQYRQIQESVSMLIPWPSKIGSSVSINQTE
ncbi:MAG: DUF1295 domain-containing protein [Sphaerochaetaceae bacterium]|jgi:steroid 5-alpha reductase family enzyme|nr:DUF1295 domain-containing protein [Sphaerochaetaceae bacterium]MDX9934190.1 DUF1295 domain-containing protein [Sphaerochaetaceae bacterium]NLO61462.1 DUF1295 domain-containing protein [Spirochaetales bacterium]